MAAIKTDKEISERLLQIDWGKPPSGRARGVDSGRAKHAPQVDYSGADVGVRIDEVFSHINAYRALQECGLGSGGLLAQSLISQANAVFNQAFSNLKSRHGFNRVYVDAPFLGGHHDAPDITGLVIDEVVELQGVLGTGF